MEVGKAYSAYDLQCKRTTLIAMCRKKVIKDCTTNRLGLIFSPRTAFEYKKI